MQIGLLEVAKHFGQHRAVGPVNLQFADTGLTVVGGPNGAGKSVLLKLLAGIIRPTSGDLLWDGQPVHALMSAYKFRIGYMPQSPVFYEDQTAATTLRYFACLKAIPVHLVTGRVDEVLRTVHLLDLAKRRVKHLSGGERSRLAFAVALLNDPDVLLLDEPGANLDPSERRQFWDLVAKIKIERSVVMATHMFAGLEGLVDRLVVLDGGRVLCDEPVDRILEQVSRDVWEIQTPTDRQPDWREEIQVVWRRKNGKMTWWHVLAAGCPVDGAQRAMATLDDVYLWLRWRVGNQKSLGQGKQR